MFFLNIEASKTREFKVNQTLKTINFQYKTLFHLEQGFCIKKCPFLKFQFAKANNYTIRYYKIVLLSVRAQSRTIMTSRLRSIRQKIIGR